MYTDARRYLKQYQQLKRMVAIKRQTREMLMEISQLSGVDFTKSRVQSTSKGDQIGNIVVRLEAMDREIGIDIMRMLDALEKIQQTINKIKSPVTREVLQRRYIFGERWEIVATEMQYSTRQVYRFHRDGLICVDKIIKMSLNDSKQI